LESSDKKRVNWGCLIAEMTAGGLIGYSFLIGQLEILMTPPRSEAWAACLGAGLAMIWHMVRNNFKSPIRVAMFSAAGAGFGFAFGNFLQILGSVLEIQFNMWNVMEYSIGFFGGISMAYSVFTSEWPEESVIPEKWEDRTAMILLFVVIPLFVITNSRLYDVLFANGADNKDLSEVTLFGGIAGIAMTIAMAAWAWVVTVKSKKPFKRRDSLIFLILYFAAYIFISYCVTGVFAGNFMLNHHLYVVNFIVVMILLKKDFPAFFQDQGPDISGSKWIKYLGAVIVIILLLAFVLINIHGEMNGANARFPAQ
jgi:hypothetical protein